MQALVLEPDLTLNIRDIEIPETLGPRDVRIQVHTVGICGSDIHYYQHGRIGPFVVEEPLVLGHEAAGVVVETGAEVTRLAPGDRVCMEPGVPPADSRAARLGLYNLDPGVLFWATPPVHGVLRPSVVHPAEFTYKLPESVSFGEGAMVEPLAIGMQAATKAGIMPGDVAVVLGAGTIGAMTTLAALAGGCSHVVVTDVKQAKLDLVARSGPVTTVNVAKDSLADAIDDLTDGWGADVVFECSGSEKAIAGVFEPLRPGGRVVLVGMPVEPVPFDVVAAQAKEATVATVFRYAHVYPRTIALLAGGKVDLKPFITDVFSFEDSVKAFDWALDMPETSVKAQIELP